MLFRSSQEQSKARKEAAEAIRAEIKTGGAEAYRKNPDLAVQQLSAIFDPKKEADSFKAYAAPIQAAAKLGNYEEVIRLLGQAANQVAQLHGAVAQYKAETPLAVDRAIATEIGKAKAAGGALASVVDPKLRSDSETQYTSAAKKYNEEAADTDKLNEFVNAAVAGNQTALSAVDMSVVRSLLNRVTQSELKAVGSGASIPRNIENTIARAAEGKLSKDQANDLKAFVNIVKDVSKRKLQRDINATNAATGSNWRLPTDVGAAPAPTGGSNFVKPGGQLESLLGKQ
mgnify:CR=1 FL=1